MLPIIAKLNVILRSEYMNSWEFLHDDSAIKEDLLFYNHAPDFGYFSILATSSNDFKVTLMGSLLINRDHPPLNKNKQYLPLKLFDR